MDSLPLQARQTLRMLGFSDNESRVLLTLFLHRRLTVKEVSQQTTLSFDAAHYSLHALEKKGLARRLSVDGEDIAEACSDADFLQWIDEQKRRNSDVYDEAKAAMSVHLLSARESSWKPNVVYFEGRQGIVDIYNDMIAQGQDIHGWTDIQKIHRTIGEHMDEFIRQRMEKRITSYAIMPKNALNHEYAMKGQMRNVKFSDYLPIDGEIRIYGNKVAVITFHDEKPVGFVFSGQVITSVFRGIFAHAWGRD